MSTVNNDDVRGLPVISVAEGERLGEITNIYVDIGKKEIVGFAVNSSGGFFSPDESMALLDAADIEAVGPDAVTVASRDSLRGASVEERYPSLVPLDTLLKQPVVTEGGQRVGEVSKVEFEPGTGRITAFEVSPGLLQQHWLVDVGFITTIGQEFVVVSDALTEEKARQDAEAESAPAEEERQEDGDAIPLT